MSGRRGNKRGQKAAEVPAEVLQEEQDVGPNLRVDQHEQLGAAGPRPDQMYAGLAADAHADLAFDHSPDYADATGQRPAWRTRLKKLLLPALRHLPMCLLLGLCVYLALQTRQLSATASSQQAALAQLRHDLASEQALLKHAGLRSLIKTLERHDKRLAHLDTAISAATTPTTPAAASAADLAHLQESLLADARAQCASCKSAATADAVQHLQDLQAPLLHRLEATISQLRSSHLDTSTRLPAIVLRHSALASPPWPSAAFAIVNRLKSAVIMRTGSLHPQATEYLQQTSPVPSRCLPLRGSSGYVDLRLPDGSLVTSLSLQHPWNRTRSASSAPQQFSVHSIERQLLGWTERQLLGTWRYQVPGPELQTFDLQQPAALTMVRVRVQSNYGSAQFTCLYSVQFHGTLRHPAPAMQ